MLIKKRTVNPLNFLDNRRLKYLPPHLETIDIPLRYNLENAVSKWITENLKDRYYIGRCLSASPVNSQAQISFRIGFENPKELSYFVLACPFMKYK